MTFDADRARSNQDRNFWFRNELLAGMLISLIVVWIIIPLLQGVRILQLCRFCSFGEKMGMLGVLLGLVLIIGVFHAMLAAFSRLRKDVTESVGVNVSRSATLVSIYLIALFFILSTKSYGGGFLGREFSEGNRAIYLGIFVGTGIYLILSGLLVFYYKRRIKP